MEKLLLIFYWFCVLSVACPTINYIYLFLATKLKFHQTFVGWVLEDDEDEHAFFLPVLSWMFTLIITVYTLYLLIWRPLYYVLATLPLEAIKWISRVLMKPIKKNQFKNQLCQH